MTFFRNALCLLIKFPFKTIQKLSSFKNLIRCKRVSIKHFPSTFLYTISLAGAIQDRETPQLNSEKINETIVERITPSVGPYVDNGINAFITADFLYWTARMDGLAYIISGIGNNVNNAVKGTTQYPHWDWNPAFKAGLGLNLSHDGWDIYVEYTWFHSSAMNSISNPDSGMLPPWNISNIISRLATNIGISAAHTHWNIALSAVDISLGRNYFISSFLTLRPFFSLKASWIDQDYRVTYNIAETSLMTRLKMHNNQNFWGIGPRTGLSTAWYLNPNWSLYGDCALSALWSQFQIRRKDHQNDSMNSGTVNNLPLNTTVTTFNSSSNFHTIKAILEFGLGIRSEVWFYEDRYHLLIQIGWEEQLWMNHNQLLQTTLEQSNRGDLILQGLTLKLCFDF